MTEQYVAASKDGRTISELINDTGEQTRRLVRDELQLAVLEMQGKGKNFAKGAGLAGAGSLLAFYGGATLVATAVIALATVLWWWASALIIGLVLLAVGAVLAVAGKNDVRKATPPVPQEAVENVQQDIQDITPVKHRSPR